MDRGKDATYINNLKVANGNGRFLNKMDIDNRRKVIVISPDMKKVLFKDQDPIDKYVVADNNIAYQIIGVYDNEDIYDNNPPAYIPFTTAQMLYNKGYGFRRIDFTVVGLKTKEANEKFVESIRQRMGKLHSFDPSDRSALYVRNTAEDMLESENIFSTITFFIIIVGAASLMAGIVGVGNIMLITVKERTREIGIRKAIGATPFSVLKLIIFEAIMITTAAGYIGMVLGIGLTELISTAMENSPSDGPSVFQNPTVDLATVIWSTLALIIAGTVAGLIPALKATRVSPIEAMRAE